MRNKTKQKGRGIATAYQLDHVLILSLGKEEQHRGWTQCSGRCLHDGRSCSELSMEVTMHLSSISGLVIASYPRVNKSGFFHLCLLQHFFHLLYLQHVYTSQPADRNNTNSNGAKAWKYITTFICSYRTTFYTLAQVQEGSFANWDWVETKKNLKHVVIF